jgi:hypothetical protein
MVQVNVICFNFILFSEEGFIDKKIILDASVVSLCKS